MTCKNGHEWSREGHKRCLECLRVNSQRWRAKNKQAGKCQCGRARIPGKKCCWHCAKRGKHVQMVLTKGERVRGVPGWEGTYSLTSKGRLWSHGRHVWVKKYHRGFQFYTSRYLCHFVLAEALFRSVWPERRRNPFTQKS